MICAASQCMCLSKGVQLHSLGSTVSKSIGCAHVQCALGMQTITSNHQRYEANQLKIMESHRKSAQVNCSRIAHRVRHVKFSVRHG